MLKHIEVRDLFGTFSYDIDIPADCNPFILTGPNGYGKTTLMRIISKLASSDLFYFYRLPFSSISITTDQAVISIISRNPGLPLEFNEDVAITPERELLFEWKSDDAQATLTLNEKLIRHALRFFKFTRQSMPATDDLNDYALYEFIRSHNDRFLNSLATNSGNSSFLMMLKSLKVQFVTAQRLYAQKDDSVSENIDFISSEFAKKLGTMYFKYLSGASNRDSHFIETLLKQDSEIAEAEYNEQCKALSKKINELRQFGLVPNIFLPEFSETKSAILAAYIKNVSDNLAVYDRILPQLQLYLKLSGEKAFVNKNVEVVVNNGLRVRSGRGELISLKDLSSGEKNILIMLYNFIFSVDNNTVLLIDEPEISLHVAWQVEFINDIKRIAAVKNLQVIIATHSPQIIGSRWNECYDLEEHQNGLDKKYN